MFAVSFEGGARHTSFSSDDLQYADVVDDGIAVHVSLVYYIAS